MRTELDHLPDSKRAELERVVKILFEEFEDAIILKTSSHLKAGRILKIILFGSHARGDWVDDRKGGYVSDYDILVVVNHAKLTDLELWTAADDHLVREVTVAKRISAPVNFIVHSLEDVNRQLKQGRYFFTDIVKDGVALYEAPKHPFAKPQPLSPKIAREEAAAYYAKWFPSAEAFMASARFLRERGNSNEAAFNLHQAAERLYHCISLVYTLYSPKSHRLNFLRSLCEEHEPRLVEAWPRQTKLEKRSFELLRRAYVDARYSPHFRITEAELGWLSERVGWLHELTESVCQERLAELR